MSTKTYCQITYLCSGGRWYTYKGSSACLLLYNKMPLLKVRAISRIVERWLILRITNAWFNQGMPRRSKCRNQHSTWPYPLLACAVLSQIRIWLEKLSGKEKKEGNYFHGSFALTFQTWILFMKISTKQHLNSNYWHKEPWYTEVSHGTVHVLGAISVIIEWKEQSVYLKFTMPFCQ